MEVNIDAYAKAVSSLEKLGAVIKRVAAINCLTNPEFSIKLVEHNIKEYGYFFPYKEKFKKPVEQSIWIGFSSALKEEYAVSLAVKNSVLTIKNKLDELESPGDDWSYLSLFLPKYYSPPQNKTFKQRYFNRMIKNMINALGIEIK